MIYAFGLLLIGSIIGQFYPIAVRSFVWGAFDKVRASQVRPLTPKIPIQRASLAELGEKVQRVWDFLWMIKWPLLVIVLLIVFGGALKGCSIPFLGQSADDLRAEIAESETEHAQAERDNAVYAGARGDETQRRERVIETVVAQGKQDIEDAVAQEDFDRLYAAYALAYERVRTHPGPDAGDDDPPARGSPMVREPPPDRA